jgi:cell division protein FtsI (penicillin-binding protein 3)
MANEKEDKRMTRGITALYVLLTLVGGIAIIASVVNIQWVHGDEWRARGIKRETGIHTDPARRGNIYSSDGKILATTVTECDFYLDLYNPPLKGDNGEILYDQKGRVKERGPIVDSNYTKRLDTVCMLLAKTSRTHNAQYYRDRIDTERQKERPRSCFLVERGVPYSTWKAITNLKGWKVGVVKKVDGHSVIHQVRAHIYGNMAGNTVGFRNRRDIGTYTGLEGSYDSLLRGQDGIYTIRRLTKGIWLPDEPPRRTSTPQRTDSARLDTVRVLQNKVDGMSIVSTIDTRFQDIAEHSLRNALHQYGGHAGCAILMEVETGYVLACANLSRDTSTHGEFMELRDRNVAVSDMIEPGSTFKTVVLTAMLNDPAIGIDTNRHFRVGSKNYLNGLKHGQVDDDHRVKDSTGKVRDSLLVREIIEQSSNVGMVELGYHYYRNAKRSDSLRTMMLEVFPYDKLNPDVKAEQSRAYIHEDMRPVANFTRLCYGYSTRVSPLQIITFYNALAGNGRMVKPLFCRATIDGKGRRREMKPVVLKEKAFDRRKAELMRSMLVGVVNRGGTGYRLKTDTYVLAGKTGTAVHNGVYNASFAGFFPAENPRYSCYVLLEGSRAYGWQAGWVVRDIADCVVAIDKELGETVRSKMKTDSTRLNQYPTISKGNQEEIAEAYDLLRLPYSTDAKDSKWVYYQEATDSTAGGYRAYEPAEGRVPNCYGMTAKDAFDLLYSQGYRVRMTGYGRVTSQSPRRGSVAKAGTTIWLTLK